MNQQKNTKELDKLVKKIKKYYFKAYPRGFADNEHPPSTTINCPVTYLAQLEER